MDQRRIEIAGDVARLAVAYRDQLGQAHCVQQAARYPACKSRSGAGQDRQSGPQGIAACRV